MTKGRFTIKEAAAALGLSEKEVRGRMKNRKLKAENGHFYAQTAPAEKFMRTLIRV